jgi:hypothetical protein
VDDGAVHRIHYRDPDHRRLRDLVAATNLGRSLAITEALFGQIYLVTIVAVIVSNLRRPARAR